MENVLNLLIRSFPLLLKGTWMTLKVLSMAGALSFVLGIVLGGFLSNQLRVPFLSWMIEGLCFVYRAIPFYVQLLIVYFVLPDLCGFSLEPFTASVISLGMCSAGYIAQIVRGSMNAIPIGQWEAAFSLGFTPFQKLRYVILPQMFRQALPALCNEFDSLLKSTAVVSSIGMLELTRVGMNLVSREMEPVAIYLTVAFFYLCLSSLLNLGMRILERRISYA